MMLSAMFMSLQSAHAMNVDAFIDQNIAPYTDKVAKLIFFPISIAGNNVPLIIFWVLFAGIFLQFISKVFLFGVSNMLLILL